MPVRPLPSVKLVSRTSLDMGAPHSDVLFVVMPEFGGCAGSAQFPAEHTDVLGETLGCEADWFGVHAWRMGLCGLRDSHHQVLGSETKAGV